MKISRLFLCLLLFIPFATITQAQDNNEKKQIEYEKWREQFINEVSTIEEPLVEFYSIFDELRSDQKFTIVERYQKCRKLIRLAYTNPVQGKIKYPQVLKVLGNHFKKAYNDTILAATLLLESNRLFIEDNLSLDNIGEIHTTSTVSLFAKFKNDREAALNMLWPAAYLFGCHGTASRLLCDLSASYFERHDYLAANFYQQRSELWKNAYVNDANTNFAIYYNRQLNIHDELEKHDLLYQQRVFNSDLSALAQKTRKYLLPVIEATEYGDIVSAYFFREIGIDFFNQRDYSYATRYFMRSVNDFNRTAVSKSDSLYYANTYYLSGLSSRYLGDTRNAKNAFSSALTILEKCDELTLSSIYSKIMLAKTQLEYNEKYSALKTINELGDFLLHEDASLYIDFLPNIGFDFKTRQQCLQIPFLLFLPVKGLSQIGEKDDDALNCFLGAQALFEHYQMQNCYLYYNNKILLARQFISLDELDKAKKELNNCISAYKSKKKIEISDIVTAYNLLGKIASLEQNHKQMSFYYSSAYQTIVEFAMSQLFTMDENERAQFWEAIKPALNETLKECIVHSKNDDTLAETAWNCSMLMKGLLLQSSNSIRNIIYDIGDKALINRYENILEEKSAHPVTHYFLDDDHDFDEIKILHDSRISEKMNQMKNSFFVKCNDIKKQLGKNDVAIEFTEIENQYNDHSIITEDKQYWAIVLTSTEKPTCVQLFREKQTKSIHEIVDPKLYRIIWEPLSEHIQNKTNIYFSPTGILHKYPIEYLSMPNGDIIAEKYNIQRLSSIKELLYKPSKMPDRFALFGGLDYFIDTETWKKWQVESLSQHNSKLYHDIFRSGDKTRGALQWELEGSKREVEFIYDLLKQKGLKCALYEHEEGSEQQFRNLSGTDVSVLHISTHGFADTSNEKTQNEYTLLSQTCLWLSGAGDAITDPEMIPQGVEDGLLTAREIVSLDLRSIKLVVLSACQTGMGTINSEGVFGLQRGFKKAGVHAILMSLRDVHDEATELLMKSFYKNVYDLHLPINEALIEAQKTVRKHPGWDDPKYWAAFILLDGLD